jgi:lysophospholipase L1-like esterase
VIGLLPRKGMEERIRRIDSELQDLVSETDAVYIDLTPALINKEGRIDASLFSDGLHPNEKGYERIASVLSSFL